METRVGRRIFGRIGHTWNTRNPPDCGSNSELIVLSADTRSIRQPIALNYRIVSTVVARGNRPVGGRARMTPRQQISRNQWLERNPMAPEIKNYESRDDRSMPIIARTAGARRNQAAFRTFGKR